MEVVSSNYDSAVLILELPLTGTTPFTHMEVEFHSPDSYVVNITILTSLELGNMKEVILPDLQDGTVYLISVSIYNCGGKGGSSQQIEVTTRKCYRGYLTCPCYLTPCIPCCFVFPVV